MSIGGIGANLFAALTPIARSMLSDSCVVKRPAHVNDGAGGYRDTLSAGVASPCIVQALGRRGGYEDVSAGRVIEQERYQISFMHGVDIAPQDQITQVSSGVTYAVTNSLDATTGSPLLTVNAVYVSK